MGESLARDRDVNRIVKQYLFAKHIPLGERCSAITEQLLGSVGLLTNPLLLLALESAYHEEQKEKAQQEETKREIENIHKNFHRSRR